MSQWKVTTPPAIQPVSVEDAFEQGNIDDVKFNEAKIKRWIASATAYAESETQLSFITRTITAQYWPTKDNLLPTSNPFLPYACLPLYRGPMQSVISVTDGYGNNVGWVPRRVGNVDFVQLAGTVVGPITVVYTAGYGEAAASVPADIRDAIIAHVAHKYRYREADADSIPTGLDYIYSRYRTGSMG